MIFSGKKAIPYIRVSSDEQAEKFSPASQRDELRKFCAQNNITIVKEFEDDHSAKTFVRPGWNRLMDFVKKNKGAVDLILFTDWSRFGRSQRLGESYMQLNELEKLGVECQAIEQPLDNDVPENLILKAVYIAMPAAENGRKRNNVIKGTRRALQEGRFCNRAPFGYRNTRDESNHPIIVIDETKAPVIREIFEMFNLGFTIQEIKKEARQKGYTVQGHSAIQKTISNPVYGGLIKVFAFKNEPEKITDGIHTGIVDKDVFWKAYNRLNSENKPKPKAVADEKLPLRGMLYCQHCNNLLTGSKSRGRHGGHWWYYRCLKCKGENYSATVAHSQLNDILALLSLNQQELDDFTNEVDLSMKKLMAEKAAEGKKLKADLIKVEKQLAMLEEKYISDLLTFDTYQRYYPKYIAEIARLREQLDHIIEHKEELIDLYRQALPLMLKMDTLYQSLNLENKQEFLQHVFARGLIKVREGYRTPFINPIFTMKPALEAILVVDIKNKNGLELPVFDQSRPQGNEIEPLLRFLLRVAA